MKKQIKGIAIDLEGPIIDFESDGHHLAHRLAAKEAGLDLSRDEAVDLIPDLIGGGGKTADQQFYDLMIRRGIRPLMTPDQIHQRSKEHFARLLEKIKNGEKPLAPRPGFPEALNIFRSLKLKVVIGSATLPEHFRIYWKAAGLNRFFKEEEDAVLSSPDSGLRPKPAPDIFIETARRMAIDPAEQLVIEDSVRGVKAGIAAGSIVLGMVVYDRPAAINPLYKEGAVKVLCGWRNVDWRELIAIISD
jgi:beta-phosphoglucomutase-like phosphatase (HAD superfamily)